MNFFKTTILLTIMTMMFGAIGYMIGGGPGMMIALLFAAATNLFAWWNSGNMVLRMHGARKVDAQSAPELVDMVAELAQNAGLPMPDVYILETDQPNAFATGRNYEHAAVAASRGLLQELNHDEIAAVMAHELAHIRTRDTLTMTITATLAGAIGMIANFAMFFGNSRNNSFGLIGTIAMMIVAPLAAGIVQMAISRTREYEADKDGAEICGNPMALATALQKIATAAGRTVNMPAEHAPATAHMFIINPLNGKRMDNLFSTHPDTENRINALYQMAQDMPQPVEARPDRRRERYLRGDSHRTSEPTVSRSGSVPSTRKPNGRKPNVRRKGPWG